MMIKNSTKMLLLAFVTTTTAFNFMNKMFDRKSSGYVEIISGLEMQTASVVAINKVDNDGVERKYFPPLSYLEPATATRAAKTVATTTIKPSSKSPAGVVVKVNKRHQPSPSPSPVLIPTTTKSSDNIRSFSEKERPKILAALVSAAACLVVGGSKAASVGPIRIVMNTVAASLYGFVWYKALRLSYGKGDRKNDETKNSKVPIGVAATTGLTNTNLPGRDMMMSF